MLQFSPVSVFLSPISVFWMWTSIIPVSAAWPPPLAVSAAWSSPVPIISVPHSVTVSVPTSLCTLTISISVTTAKGNDKQLAMMSCFGISNYNNYWVQCWALSKNKQVTISPTFYVCGLHLFSSSLLFLSLYAFLLLVRLYVFLLSPFLSDFLSLLLPFHDSVEKNIHISKSMIIH